ncbi:MAG TPA: hypothetical protein VG935_04865, partial [Patescibacteria group bacterium]|nr:hypothetical protein [Patescibacteria group bacterium]
IESQNGQRGQAVAISREDPVIMTTYHFSPTNLISAEGAGIFLSTYLKTILNLGTTLFVLSPILIYLLIRLIVIKYFRGLIFIAFILMLVIYTFFLGKLFPGGQVNSSGITIITLLSWAIIVGYLRIKAGIWFVFSICFFTLMVVILVALGRPDIADRAATLAAGFFFFGVIHVCFEYIFPDFFIRTIGDLLLEFSLINKHKKIVKFLKEKLYL